MANIKTLKDLTPGTVFDAGPIDVRVLDHMTNGTTLLIADKAVAWRPFSLEPLKTRPEEAPTHYPNDFSLSYLKDELNGPFLAAFDTAGGPIRSANIVKANWSLADHRGGFGYGNTKAAGKNVIQYIGIAADEQKRLQRLPLYKVAPLAKFGFTEADALAYCYDRGFFWEENGIRLYDVLDRVSCWCCANKNLKELRNIRTHLPKYWNRLKDLQGRTDRPMKGPGKSVFDLEERFGKEAAK